jgi:hypothetical protein
MGAQAAEPGMVRQVLFANVNNFDGYRNTLAKDRNVLVAGHLTKQVGKDRKTSPGAKVIDGAARTLLAEFLKLAE